MLVDGQTHLVLIREEAGAPDAKVRRGGSGNSLLARVTPTPPPALLGAPLMVCRAGGLYDPLFALSSPASSQAG